MSSIRTLEEKEIVGNLKKTNTYTSKTDETRRYRIVFSISYKYKDEAKNSEDKSNNHKRTMNLY